MKKNTASFSEAFGLNDKTYYKLWATITGLTLIGMVNPENFSPANALDWIKNNITEPNENHAALFLVGREFGATKVHGLFGEPSDATETYLTLHDRCDAAQIPYTIENLDKITEIVEEYILETETVAGVAE